MSRWLTRCAIALLLAIAFVPGAGAQEPPRPAISTETLIEAARNALAKGELDDAEFLLEGLEPGEGDVDELDFLRGMIAMQRGNWQSAIARFRAMLIRNPDLPRPRLELARAFFLEGEDNLARHHFERVLAGKPPEAVVKNVQRYLDAIRARRRWDAHFGLALAPDSNVNNASTADIVWLYGLPFRVTDESKPSSGVGLIVWGGAEYQHPLSNRWRLRAGADRPATGAPQAGIQSHAALTACRSTLDHRAQRGSEPACQSTATMGGQQTRLRGKRPASGKRATPQRAMGDERKGELARTTLRRFQTTGRSSLGFLADRPLAGYPGSVTERNARLWRRTPQAAITTFHAPPNKFISLLRAAPRFQHGSLDHHLPQLLPTRLVLSHPGARKTQGSLAQLPTLGLQPRFHFLRIQPATVSDPGRARVERPVLRLRAPPW